MGTIRDIFKANLIDLRGDRSLKTVATGAGIPYSTYQRFEAKEPNLPSDEHMAALAKFFNVPLSRFFRDPHLDVSPKEALEVLIKTLAATGHLANVSHLLAIPRTAIPQVESPESQSRKHDTEWQEEQKQGTLPPVHSLPQDRTHAPSSVPTEKTLSAQDRARLALVRSFSDSEMKIIVALAHTPHEQRKETWAALSEYLATDGPDTEPPLILPVKPKSPSK